MRMFAPVIKYLVISGISEYAIILLLFLPIISAFIAFARYIIGWRSINIYTTILLSYALFDLGYHRGGAIDYAGVFFYGGMLILVSTSLGILVQTFTRELRIHYLSKVSLVMSAVTLGVFALLFVSTFIKEITLENINALTLVIFIISVEALVKSYIRHGIKKALQLMISTIILTFVIFLIMSRQVLLNALFDYPEISLLMIVLSVVVGRWRGLKLIEYFRFRSLLQQETHDTEDFS